MKNNGEMEGPKYKRKKENSRKGRVAGRKEGGSFLLFKVRLRVIHKKKKNREKEDLERERLHLLSRFSDNQTIGLRRSNREVLPHDKSYK